MYALRSVILTGVPIAMIVDRRELEFVLFELLEVERLLGRGRFSAYDLAAVGQMLDSAQQIAEELFLPIAAEVDAKEPFFSQGKVVMPEGTGKALQAYAAAGLFALPFAEDLGGLQAPWFLHTAISGMFTAANVAVANYAFLTIAAANLLNAFGSETLRVRVLPPMLEGRWFGTMCLSEPDAGSSLGDIRTMATPAPDGTYRIKGSKMWISGGEHELSENIVHMVLAKTPGAPAGSRGISLFLVPKRLVMEDGSAGALNNIALAGLNHKMGQRGTTNCLLNFGESGDCIGYLIGEANRGLEYMFHMMNEARIGVGHASTMAGLAGYLYSADYARTRLQGRRIDQRDPTGPQVPLIEHADVRRMLLAQKSAVEGAQALCLYLATLIDRARLSDDAEEQQAIDARLGLLTPVVKSWPSEHCLEANKWAIQILGGYGYTRDYPVERLYRDNRLNHIHEGTFGIQGLDLVNRKIAGDKGSALEQLISEMRVTAEDASETPSLAALGESLKAAASLLSETAKTLIECTDVALRTANATVFLDAFGHVVIAWVWLRKASVATAALDTGAEGSERNFYSGKVAACRYFFAHELPLAKARLKLCKSLDRTSLEADAEIFT